MFLAVLIFTPKAAFSELGMGERTTWLRNVAARLQEFTGADGGVCFSERVLVPEGKWSVMLIAQIGSDDLLAAFGREIESESVKAYFDVAAITGPALVIEQDGDAGVVLQRILDPFLG